jgi:hypothetical protein
MTLSSDQGYLGPLKLEVGCERIDHE